MDNDKKSPAFEETYKNYLAQMQDLAYDVLAARLETELRDGAVPINMLGKEFLVSPDGITTPDGKSEPVHAEKVTLCKYFIMFPDHHPKDGDEYTSYREFKDAAPFVGGFKTNAEIPIARNFSGRLDALREAAAALGGEDPGIDLAYDFKMRFTALPHLPVVLLFNDEDEEFPADALILFQRRADQYLDMECLAIIGWLLADYLTEKAGGPGGTIM